MLRRKMRLMLRISEVFSKFKSDCHGITSRIVPLVPILLGVAVLTVNGNSVPPFPEDEGILFDDTPVSIDANENRTILTVKRCAGSKEYETLELPTLSLFSTNEYYYKPQIFRINGTLDTCPTGELPVQAGLQAMSILEFKIALNEPNLIFEYIRNEPFLFSNGVLSVGKYDVAWSYSPEEFCIQDVQNHGDEAIVVFRTCAFDKSRPIYSNCCPIGTALNEATNYTACEATDIYAVVPKFLEKNSLKLISFQKANPVVVSPSMECHKIDSFVLDECNSIFNPATNNRVAFIGAQRNWEFFPDAKHCFSPAVDSNGTKEFVLYMCPTTNDKETDKNVNTRLTKIYLTSISIGAFFHFLTTLVYLVTWTKQNIHGRTLCSCTGSLFFMFLFLISAYCLGIYNSEHAEAQKVKTFCIITAIGAQFFMISAFTWLLAVNIDLWRTFRFIRQDGSKGTRRFLGYCCLGWGFPMIVVLVSIVLNFSFKCRKSGVLIPEYGGFYCFVAPWAQGYYLYYILGFLILLCCVFALMTLFALYNFKKGTSNMRSTKKAQEQENILLFMKLGVVMGLTWIFEVVSWLVTTKEPNGENSSLAWIILDTYNALSAILIFIIFVCKRSTLTLLEQTIPALKRITEKVTNITSIFSGSSSDTDYTMVGSSSPKNSK